ncbi:MAG: hypothetical protein ACJA04_001135, partial [Cellvibrionaceae bacterium]
SVRFFKVVLLVGVFWGKFHTGHFLQMTFYRCRFAVDLA